MKEHGWYEIDIHNQIVIVRFFSAWNEETSRNMCNQFRNRVAEIADKPWACLVDLSNWELGGQEVWEPIIEVNHWCNDHNQELEAVVCTLKIQQYILMKTQEALPETESAFFDTLTDAEEWLCSKGYVM